MSLVSSRMVEWIEMSRDWMQHAFGAEIERPENTALLEKIQTATRAGSGYWLMLVLNTKREINLEKECQNVTALIKALLSHT